MSSFHSANKQKNKAKIKSRTGSEEGRLYEKISLMLIAKRIYEVSKIDNSKFRDFAIGREVDIGKDGKFDDVVFSYRNEDHGKNLIFLQIKHKQDDYEIDSQVLSTEATRSKGVGGSDGGLCRDFNLQKYFISYLSVRDELKMTQSKELKGGKIKYVAIFTNIGLNSKELNDKGFNLKEAPADIVNLFTLKKSPSEAQHANHCYQLGDVSESLRKILKKSSDLHRLAMELAKCVVWKNDRGSKIMGIDETPIKHYHVALEKHVIQKSDHVENNMRNEPYRECKFRDDFLDCETSGPEQELRHAIFEAIRELDESKLVANDDELKIVLKEAKWKVVPNFGKSKRNVKNSLPDKWKTVEDETIANFLKCLVFIVNQPRVTELEALYKSSIEGIVVENTVFKQFLVKIKNTGPEFSNCIEKAFGIHKKPNYKERWICDDKIKDFIEEKKQLVNITFAVSAMTQMYRNELMQVGKFYDCGKITEYIDNFLASNHKILCVNTPSTVLSSIKILQHFNSEKVCNEGNVQISVSLNILNCIENRNCVLKAFELEGNGLLIIECNHTTKVPDVKELFYKLFNVAKRNSSKKIILTVQEENCGIFMKNIKTDFQDERLCVEEHDSVHLKYFEPKEDPLQKNVLVFQGQKEKTNLSNVTGITSWSSYVDNLPQGTNEPGIIDVMAFLKILNNDEIEVGSKILGTSSLDGAYAKMFEEINDEILVHKLLSHEQSTEVSDTYIISGICGNGKQDEIDKLIECLGFSDNKRTIERQLRNIVDCGKLKIAGDKFKDEDFQTECHENLERRVFWVCVKGESNERKFYLQQVYNPKFYLKRKFKTVIIKKALRKLLIKEDLSEIFIFHSIESKVELFTSCELNECDEEKCEKNFEKGMFRLFMRKTDAEVEFKECFRQNQTVHLLQFEKNQFVWCDSYGSLAHLNMYIDHQKSEISCVDEDKLLQKFKNRKVIIFADDPGMGKTTTLIKLCETESQSLSIIRSHWVIVIKIREHLKAVRDIDLTNDGINITSIVDFLTKVDLKLDNNIARNLLEMSLDKSRDFSKPLLLAFDGFDEILDEDDRSRVLQLLIFLKNETAAKLWITTRLQHKAALENDLQTLTVQFHAMDRDRKTEYIENYLKDRLYFILNDERYAELFDSEDKKQVNKNSQTYIAAFLNKMESVFRGDISATFIETPLQLRLMLENSAESFKVWTENKEVKNPDFNHVGNNIREIYKKFIEKKYEVYFRKLGIREHIQKRQEKTVLDQYHKDFAKSRILGLKQKNFLNEFKDKILLAGIIKSEGSEPQFIHKTFEEFFAAKVFILWIENASNKFLNICKHEYLLTVILLRPDYQLIRTFMNFQLKKIMELDSEKQNVPEESVKHYGNIISKLLENDKSPLICECLHVAIAERNKYLAFFLLKSLKGHPDFLKKFLFFTRKDGKNALHLACKGEDDEIVKFLLDAAAGISQDTLQEYLKSEYVLSIHSLYVIKCDYSYNNALDVAIIYSHNVLILKELLDKTINKLDLILRPINSFSTACLLKKEEFVLFLLQEFKNEKNSLRQLLLHEDDECATTQCGNALYKATLHNTILDKLLSAAKSMNDKNETLRNLLLPKKGVLTFNHAISKGSIDTVGTILSAAKHIDDGNQTLEQLLFIQRHEGTALHSAAVRGCGDIIKLLLKTAADLSNTKLEKFIFAVNEEGKTAVQLMVENGHEDVFANCFQVLENDRYVIWTSVTNLFNSVPLKSKLFLIKRKLNEAIVFGDIDLIKYILHNADKYSSASLKENLESLLFDRDLKGQNSFDIAREKRNWTVMSELLLFAITCSWGRTLFQVLT